MRGIVHDTELPPCYGGVTRIMPAAEKKAEDDSEEEASVDTGSKVGEEEGNVDGEEGNSGKKSKTDAAPAEEKR